MITAYSTSPFVRASNERLISSMANTMPASGALNAAAIPAAEPARIKPRSLRSPRSRATCSMIVAPTCTVGPSRPTEAPHISPSTVKPILPAASRSESNRRRAERCPNCRAAIACGMPLPCAPGNSARVAQAQARIPPG